MKSEAKEPQPAEGGTSNAVGTGVDQPGSYPSEGGALGAEDVRPTAKRSTFSGIGVRAAARGGGPVANTPEEQQEIERRREEQFRQLTGQPYNSAYKGFKRAMDSTKNSPPPEVFKQYQEAVQNKDAATMATMFKSFFVSAGSYVRMQLIMSVAFSSSVSHQSADRGFTRAQLADHYKVQMLSLSYSMKASAF